MSTKHEYCEHLDRRAGYGSCDIEQMQDEREMKEAYDAALQRQGAKDALHELKRYLLYIADDDRFADERKGILESVSAINRRLSDLEVMPEVGGEFPEGYFAEGSAA